MAVQKPVLNRDVKERTQPESRHYRSRPDRALCAEDLGSGAIENLGDALGFFRVARAFAPQRILEVMASAVNLVGGVRIANAGECLPDIVHPASDPRQGVQNRIGGGSVGGEMGLPLRRDPIELARAFLLHARMADLVKIGERRIDHAGTGSVEAAGTLLDRLDQFIAVSGALAEQRENEKLQI